MLIRGVSLSLVFVLLFSLLIGAGSTTLAQGSTFTDVPSNAWGHKEIHHLKDNGIINGYPDGSFRPNNTLTRAQASVILTGALGVDGLKVNKPTFRDVNLSYWASPEIERAASMNILTGRSDNRFSPGDQLTKAQAAAVITRAFKLNGSGGSSFSDVRSGFWAEREIKALEQNGIVETGGRFEPGKAITRSQFATYVARAKESSFRLNQQQQQSQSDKVQFAGIVSVSSTLNVRSGAGTSHGVIGSLRNGQRVDIYETVGSWYKIKFGNGWGYVSTSFVNRESNNSSNSILNNRVIAIDPGHGGRDPGAVGNGLQEKDIVLAVGLELEKKLKSAGAKPIMTRNRDVFIELNQRAKIANDAKADIFVSIHVNSGPSGGHGTETWISASSASSKESRDLAEKINKRLVEELGTRDRGVKTANFAVLRETNMPSVLVELGFITNSSDASLMKRSNFNERAANAIYKGIEDYYRSK
ncbi:N-acetylmuramoyl-L-alanine amidase [Alkalihalobacillus sp. MEB130]|uniref:N-acetylmuramoyl-L-alanine amidase n=1 Tax=Alkalihalobacillus sp. MEB130 TaxID=2976704 RepID=UPI0028DD68A6|nr:N-acetylmuramoyl-L-alanine amidase [Alkalihalobacillus sp. MEB130]MDT8858819.1 N-acetylmuramoyl-L-alanine amidase [Alkalihalobacillus sp. MEB130]